MNKCSKCGNEFDGKFCSECGTPLAAQPTTANGQNATTPQPFKAAKMVVKQETYVIPSPSAPAAGASQPAQAPQNAFTPPHHTEINAATEALCTKAEPTEVIGAIGAIANAPYNAASSIDTQPQPTPISVAPQNTEAITTEPIAGSIEAQLAQMQQQGCGEIAQPQPAAVRKPSKLAAKIENLNTAKNGLVAKILRYLPASLNIFFGALIMIFLALPAVGGMLEMLMPQPGYALLSDFSVPGASVGVIFLLICGTAYLGLGGLKMLWAYKKPYYKNKMVSAISVALMAVAFIMSCVYVGSLNTFITSAGASGALILTCSIFGGIILILEAVAKKIGCFEFMSPLQADAASAHNIEVEKKKVASLAQLTAQTATSAQIGANNVVYTAPVSGGTVHISTDEPLDCISEHCKRGAKKSRFAPGIYSIITACVMALLCAIPLATQDIVGLIDPVFIIPSIMGIVASFFYFICGIYRIVKAYSDPYEKHPVCFIIQDILMGGMITCLVLSALAPTIFGFDNQAPTSMISLIPGYIYLLAYGIGVLYHILVTKTFKRGAVIKSERAKLLRNPQKMQGKSKLFIAVMAIVFVLCSVLCPVIGIISAGGGLGGSSLGNKFDKVDIGDSKFTVEEAIGEPFENKFGNYTYYSKNYTDLMEKIDSTMDFEEAIKLEGELSELEFDKLVVVFDNEDKANKVTYYKQITEFGSDEPGEIKTANMKNVDSIEYYEVETYNGYKEKSTVSGSLVITGFDGNKLQTSIFTSFGEADVSISTSSLNNASEFTLEESNGVATVEFDNSESNMLLIDMDIHRTSYTEDSNFVNSLTSIIQYFRSYGKTTKLMSYTPGDTYFEILVSIVDVFELYDSYSEVTVKFDYSTSAEMRINPTGPTSYNIGTSFTDKVKAVIADAKGNGKKVVLTNYLSNLGSIAHAVDEFDINTSVYYGNGKALFDITNGNTRGLVKYIVDPNSSEMISLSSNQYYYNIDSYCFPTVSNEVKVFLSSNTVQRIENYAFGSSSSSNRSYYLFTDSSSLASSFSSSNMYGVRKIALKQGISANSYVRNNFSYTGTTNLNGYTYNIYTY